MYRRPKRKPAEHANQERWVISYADFVTLLFAFFVVMFATANADKAKARAVSEAVKAAFSQGATRDLEAALEQVRKQQLPTPTSAAPSLTHSQQLLEQALQDEIKRGEVEVHMEPRGLVVSFKQGALFDSGADTVKASALPTMQKAAGVLIRLQNLVRLEGHTDNLPIHNLHFRNNWELSSARSIAILTLLSDQCGIDRRRLSVSGYADVAPVASNESEEGRAKNRRVDVVILSELGARSEPGQAGTLSNQSFRKQ